MHEIANKDSKLCGVGNTYKTYKKIKRETMFDWNNCRKIFNPNSDPMHDTHKRHERTRCTLSLPFSLLPFRVPANLEQTKTTSDCTMS